MRAMKDSGIEWIGQIPENWSVEALKRNVKIEMGQSPASECYNSDGVGFPFLQGNADFTDKFPVERMYTSAANKFSKTGDLLLSVRAPVGAVNIADKEYAIGRGLCAITGGRISIPFLWYAIAVLNHEFDANSTGSTFESINTEDVGNAKIMVPGEDEQRRIAEYLDVKCAEIDALIAAKEKTNALLKERRQSIIYEAVTKGLNPDAPMKDSGIEWIGEIPEHWKVERLKPHIEFNPKTAIPEYGEEDSVSFIPMDCLRRGVHTSQTVDYSKVKSGYVDFAEGDILMAKVTPCLENGNLAIAGNLIDGVGFGSTEINVIRCKSIYREYLFYILQCKTYVDRAVADMYGVAGLKRLNPSFIPNTKYPMPSIEEQQGIAEHLASTCSEIDELVAANERTIEKLKEYRQSVIYEAVTGKIEI